MHLRILAYRFLLVATLIIGLALPATARSSALAGPCVASGVYDAACDVNHDGVVDVVDIQLTAGHWSQTGPYTADGWLLTGNAGTNPTTNFLGTTDAQPLVLKVNNQPALRLEPTGGQNAPNIIEGHPFNYVPAGVFGATVSGGGNNLSPNTVTASYGTVSGGELNEASAVDASVGGGALNIASGILSSVPGGSSAVASHYGEMAHAIGGFNAYRGTAQASEYVLRREIPSTAGNRELFLDGFSERITLAVNRAAAFDILIVARSNAGETSAWRVEGVVENSAGTTALIGTPIKTTLGEDDVAWDVAVLADDANDALAVVGYTNQSGDTVRFVATVRTTEVAW